MNLFGLAGNLLDGAHEDVGHDADSEEGVEQTDQVEHGPGSRGPGHLQEEGQDQALLCAVILGPAPAGLALGVAQGGLVPGPQADRVVVSHFHFSLFTLSSRFHSLKHLSHRGGASIIIIMIPLFLTIDHHM